MQRLYAFFKAVIHACNWYEKKFGKIDGTIILQPTSPFKLKTIKEMIKLFILNKKKSVVCVLLSIGAP